MRSVLHAKIITLLPVFCIACGTFSVDPDAESAGGDPVGSTTQTLVGGIVDVDDTFGFVGKISGDVECTATYLNCGVAVTATHCIEKYLDGKPDTNGIERFKGNGVKIAKYVTLTHAKRLTTQPIPEDEESNVDLALVAWVRGGERLGKVALIADLDLAYGDQLDTETTLVGYDSSPTRKYAITDASIGPVSARAWLRAEPGDSGGPILKVRADGKFEVIGVLNTVPVMSQYSFYAGAGTNSERRNWVLEGVKQLSFDTDGDGVLDACDVCPLSALASTGEEIDSDGDGIPNACDEFPCSPVAPAQENKPDQDHDGLASSCDPNAMDAKGRDPEFCKRWCAVNPIDNCPAHYNPGQENCNSDAERAVKATVMGNPCDPVPCANGEPVYTEVTTDSTEHPPSHSKVGFVNNRQLVSLDKFNVERIVGALRDPNLDEDPTVCTVDLAYRYCHPIEDRIPCSSDALISDGYLKIPELEEKYNSIWHVVHAGHNVSPPEGGLPDGLPNDLSSEARDWCPLDQFGGIAYDGGGYDVKWFFESDFDKWDKRWEDGPKLVVGPKGPDQYGGRFWFHVGTDVGLTHPDYDTHPMLDPNETPHDLANHYTYVTPQWDYNTWGLISGPLPVKRRLDFELHCLECGMQDLNLQIPPWAVNPREKLVIAGISSGGEMVSGFLSPKGGVWTGDHVLSPDVISSLSDRSLIWLNAAEANPLTGHGSNNPMMVALNAEGTSIARSLSASPTGLVVSGGDNEMLVPIDSVGNNLPTDQNVSRMMTSDRQAISDALDVNIGGDSGNMSYSDVLNLTRTTDMGASRFQAVYVRTMGLVFVIGTPGAADSARTREWSADMASDMGGSNQASMQQLPPAANAIDGNVANNERLDGPMMRVSELPGVSEGAVWAIDVVTGQRMQLAAVGYVPGNVLSATYSVRDKAMWLIEEVATDQGELLAQIVRIGVPDVSIGVFGPWARLGQHDKLWLTVDLHGRIVLVASSESLSKYSVQVLREHGGKLYAEWIHTDSNGSLGGAPIVDQTGLRVRMSTGETVRVPGFDRSYGGDNGAPLTTNIVNQNLGVYEDTIGGAFK
ncbi:MAG: hypothetical protein FWD57_13820 [Polyangiaceae bacterium]|nr:hypothetical protein [Polyangiaceae bacterium]